MLLKQEREMERLCPGALSNRHYSDYRRAAPALMPDPFLLTLTHTPHELRGYYLAFF